MKPLTITLVGVLIAVVAVGVLVRVFESARKINQPDLTAAAGTAIGQPARVTLVPTATAAPATAQATALPGIRVSLVSSSTKRDWLDQAAARFNIEGWKTANGIPILVEVTHTTSGGSMNRILGGESKPAAWSPGDQSWVNLINENWQQRENRHLISESCPSTVYAPIGFAMWRPMAEALGWPDQPIGWNTIVELAEDPQGWAAYGRPEWNLFRFGHSHPAYSNTGLLAMTSFVYGIAGSDEEMTPAQVYGTKVEQAMRALEQNTTKYGRSSSALFDLMAQQGPSYVHAIAASEETTLRYNQNNREELRFPLAFIFPAEGTIWADHPYCILDNAEWVTVDQVEAATIFREYLLAPERQRLTVENRLRPVDSSISLHAPLDLANGTDSRVNLGNATNFPSPDADVGAAVTDLFLITKRKATVIIALDVSGSMSGRKIKTATDATADFLARLDPNDEVALLTFSGDLATLSPPERVGDVVEDLAQRVRGLTANGSTALHAAVCRATELASELQARDQARSESRLYGIILLSDGDDTLGQPSEHQMFTTCLPATAEADGFKIFPIAFGGEANEPLLRRIALATGGRMFTADPDSISSIYFSISAEQ